MDHNRDRGQDHYYAVLNINKGASLAEVNERYRALSLTFHPDKQNDEPLKKEAATKVFLEIQKAYQVLSDPFTRQVYDELGPEAVAWSWPPDLRFKTKEEITEALRNGSIHYQKHKARTNPNKTKTATTCTINASPIFSRSSGSIIERLNRTQIISRNIHVETSQISVGKQTSLYLEGHSGVAGTRSKAGIIGQGSFGINGTVRHQFSPRYTGLVSIGLLFPHVLKCNLNYEDPQNTVQVNCAGIPFLQQLPSSTISWSRRLFRKKHYRGKLDIHLGPQPSMAFHFIRPAIYNATPEEASSHNKGPPLRSESGLKKIATGYSVGIAFDAFLPKLVAESAITFLELSARLRGNVQWGFTGLMANAGVEWFNESLEVAMNIALSASAIVLELNLSYLDQRISLPIMLSAEASSRLVLGTVIIPSTLLIMGYRFVLLPSQRRKRLEYIQKAHRMLEEDSDIQKERSATEALLKERVRRIVKTESDRQGLIIREATYGADGTDESTSKLAIDVQVPLQALVRNSQLHIAGGTSKTAIQGFLDPAPFVPKILRIRYTFGGATHYAEIPDDMAVVLPLAEHRLDNASQQL